MITTRTASSLGLAVALGAAVFAPAAQAATGPYMNVDLKTAVNGNTVTLTYTDSGRQYYLTDGKTTFSSEESMGYQIDYGDNSIPDGANGGGGATCNTSGPLAPFSDSTGTWLKHTYAKPGTYTITATGYYCGKSAGKGQASVTKKLIVTVGGNSKPQPAPSGNASAQPRPDHTTSGVAAPTVGSAPATGPKGSSASKAASGKTGPRVETDSVEQGNTDNVAVLAGGAALVVAAGAGVAMRRRQQNG